MKEPKSRKKIKSSYNPLVPAVEQASKILLCLGGSHQSKMGLTEICRQVGIYKSKGFSILNTLKQFGFVEKDPQMKTYSLGSNLIFLSRSVLDNLIYPEVVIPYLETLSKETSGAAIFGLISDSHVIALSKREGNLNIGFSVRLGHRFHITLGAHGKAILAFMSEAEREKILAKKKLYFYGEGSHLDMKRLRRELTECRHLGFAKDIGEVTPGISVVSSPIFGFHERLIGCIILVGPFLESKIQEFGPKVVNIAKQISHKLGADVKTVYPI